MRDGFSYKALQHFFAEKGGTRRRRLNVMATLISFFVPWFLFTALFAVFSFDIHYDYSLLAWLLALVGLAVVGMFSYLSYDALRMNREPTWHIFLAATCLIAWSAAIGLGGLNFTYHMNNYYDVKSLHTYTNVDPTSTLGSTYMDMGLIQFVDGAYIDQSHAMSFKDDTYYCVAPITKGTMELASYDWWAVGKDCCTSESGFKCGDYNVKTTREGLRIFNNQDRQYFRLAVEQAEAGYDIHSSHPIFFEWMEDASTQVETWHQSGTDFYKIGVICFAAFQALLVFGTAVAYVKFKLFPAQYTQIG